MQFHFLGFTVNFQTRVYTKKEQEKAFRMSALDKRFYEGRELAYLKYLRNKGSAI
ncbi:hypothetical protein ACFPU1_07610 [Thalassorhabdus alkalitolerans]|uniref:Uncharacterized protein n=1 Tax=Thalassorhabdus alkalitolerans TaxID=2282697 RepID=A0ABW0YJU0_9BACI|nr:hypothetical protein [Thalassobacillus sp. C254]